MNVEFQDLLSPESKRDAVSFFTRWREAGPLGHVREPDGSGNLWVVLGYEDSIAVLSDPRFIKDRARAVASTNTPGQPGGSSAALSWRRDMLRVDPPDHTRLRSILAKAFTPHAVERLRPFIQRRTDALLDAVRGRGHMDVISELAFPLPIAVLCELLGIAPAACSQFSAMAHALLLAPDAAADSQAADATASLLEELLQSIKGLIAKKRVDPGPDLTSALIRAAEGEGAVLSEIELVSMLWLLIYAGYETTVNLIGNGVLALLQHPRELRKLQQDPSLLPAAVEEILRYTTPVLLSTPRFASQDISLHGKVIRKGERVFVSLIAADTDPRGFVDPQRFDVTRPEKESRHLAFGRGIHYCLGAPLARLEGQIALGTLLKRLPSLRPAQELAELSWTQNLLARGVHSLKVAF